MYGQNRAPQAERTRTRTSTNILGIDQQKVFVWRWAVAILLTSLIFAAGNVVAGTNTAYSIHYAQVKHQHVQTAGYLVAWMGRLSGLAKEAFNGDDYAMAKRIWQILAEAGNAEAAYDLGMLYDTGADGVEQDPEQAAHWYLQAAEAGHLHAQHNLAVAYASGDGVKMDIGQALMWWERAARIGNPDSQYNLGIVYAMGAHGVKKNLNQAKKWWRKAAIKGDPMAQYNLGTIYANGEDILSYCEATRWWEKSASMGVQQASWALEVIKTRQDYLSCW